MTFLPLPTVRWVQKITRTLFLLLAPLPSAPCHAQTELGQPLITTWTPDDYQTNSFIWSVTQDDRGVMYFGTDEGVLEFDGHTWQTLPLPNNSRAASVGRGPDGRIYVGGVGDIGYLAPDSLGQMTVVSLLDEAPPEARTFSDVWILRATSTAVYFGTNFIFEWTPDLETASAPHATGTMRTWPAANDYHGGYVANDRFYIRKWDEGLLRIAGDSLVLAPSGEQFAGERIYTMLPFDEGRTLVGTRTQGLFLYDGSRFEPFETEADAQLLGRQLYMPGTVIPGGFLLNTLNGALVVGRDGRLVRVLDETNGLTG
ncbi:MAG: histidine kinase, partial [Bacteroidota bacterium]